MGSPDTDTRTGEDGMKPTQPEFKCPNCGTGYIREIPCGDYRCRNLDPVPIAKAVTTNPKLPSEEVKEQVDKLKQEILSEIEDIERAESRPTYHWIKDWLSHRLDTYAQSVRTQTIEDAKNKMKQSWDTAIDTHGREVVWDLSDALMVLDQLKASSRKGDND